MQSPPKAVLKIFASERGLSINRKYKPTNENSTMNMSTNENSAMNMPTNENSTNTAWKVSVFELILVSIFPDLDWITPNTDTFYAVQV